jgi:hypothetical protein
MKLLVAQVFLLLLFLSTIDAGTKKRLKKDKNRNKHPKLMTIKIKNNADLTFSGQTTPKGRGFLLDHGGPVLTAPNIYTIFYGDSWSTATMDGINTFLTNLGQSNYLKNTIVQLGAGQPTFKSSAVLTSVTINDISSRSAISSYLKKKIAGGLFGSSSFNPQGIYVFLVDKSRSKWMSGYDSTWGGYHSHWGAVSMGTFAVIGGGGNNCKWNFGTNSIYTSTPTNDVWIDYVFSMIAHEVPEAISDPFLTKWYDSSGYENGDKCNAYPVVANLVNKSTGKGPLYNAIIGGQYYFLQTNYDNEKNICPQVIWDDSGIY